MAAVRDRLDPGFGTALVTAGLLRLVAVVGQHPFVYVDSIDYDTLDFSGRSRRPWATPLLYRLVADNDTRIVAQACIGIACWSFLAVEVTRHVRDQRLRWGLLVSVLLLSLTTTVTNWDTTILSEPLAISLTALLIGVLLRYARQPDWQSALVVLLAAVPWVFTRQSNLVIELCASVMVLVLLAIRTRRSRLLDRPLAALAGGLVVIGGLAAVSYGRNTEVVHQNLASVMGNRILVDDGDTAWFRAHGMPATAIMTVPLPASGDALLAVPEFREWVNGDGVSTYARFLALHPWIAVTRPLEALLGERPPTFEPNRPDDAMLSGTAYGAGRAVIPEPIEALFFDPGSTGTLVFLFAVVGALSVHRWRRSGADPRWLAPLLLVAVQWPALTVVWHASTAELERLALVSLMAIWVGLLVQLALLADDWSSRPAVPETPPDTRED
jgi:hypothetical protein